MPDTGGSDGFQRPQELQGAGKTAQETTGQIPGETKAVLASSDETEGRIRGLRTAAAR